MGRLKKVSYPAENGELIYVAKRTIDLIKKKTIITKQYVDKEKLVIEYHAKHGSNRGVMELNDMGPY